MSFRIFLTGSGIAEQARAALLEKGCVIEGGSPDDTPDELARRIGGFRPDALIVRQGSITADVQGAAPGLRVITKHGVGTDNIDIAAATRRGIPVLFTPGTNANAAAEHTLGLIFALMRQIPAQDRAIRRGVFDKQDYGGLELGGRTLGLIGFGRIARRVAELVAPFGMPVLVYHPSGSNEPLPPHVAKVDTVGDVFGNADVVSLHCPLTDATRKVVDADAFALMKDGAILVNTARGGLVDEAALVSALQSGRLHGAALDVFDVEPLAKESRLRDLENVVLTAHVAGVSDRSFVNMGLMAVANVLAVLEGRAVDPAVVLDPQTLNP